MKEVLKQIIIWVVIFSIAGLIVAYAQDPSAASSLKSKFFAKASSNYLSLEDFNRNPSNYLSKEVTIIGHHSGTRYWWGACKNAVVIADEQGYSIDVCPLQGRDVGGKQEFTFKGVIEWSNDSRGTYGDHIMLIEK